MENDTISPIGYVYERKIQVAGEKMTIYGLFCHAHLVYLFQFPSMRKVREVNDCRDAVLRRLRATLRFRATLMGNSLAKYRSIVSFCPFGVDTWERFDSQEHKTGSPAAG